MGVRVRKVGKLMGVAAWLLFDGALDTIAPLVGLGAAAGIDRGYVNAIDRAMVTVGKVGLLILAIPYDMATKGGIFLDNQFLKYGLATFGDVVSNLARDPGKTLVALTAGYLLVKILVRFSSYFRKRLARRPVATLRELPH